MAMQDNLLAELSLQQLRQAVAIREKIEVLEKELERIIAGRNLIARSAAAPRKGRMSAAAKAKISAAMKARWARRKGKRPRFARSGLAANARTPAAGKAGKAGPRAPLKGRILQALKAAGKPGVTVKELAAELGKNYGNISVWFHTTAKGVKDIKKVAPGRFAWTP